MHKQWGFMALWIGLSLSMLGTPSLRSISVQGMAEQIIMANQPIVRIAIRAHGMSRQEAFQLASEKIQVIDPILTQYQPNPSDIQTINSQLSPDYQFMNGKRELNGYHVLHQLHVRLQSISQYDELMERLVDNDIAEIQLEMMTLTPSDMAQYQLQQRALEHATEQARRLATLSGYSIGRVITVSATPVQLLSQTQADQQSDTVQYHSQMTAPVRLQARIDVTFELID